jgi:hypothetical protein
MAISRPILLALVGAILALVAFYATSGGREAATESSEPAGPAPEDRPAPAKRSPERKTKAPGAEGRAGGSATRPAQRDAARRQAPRGAAALPAGVTRALARKRIVVLFFFQRRAADDDATARSVSSLRGRSGVQVFSAPISKLGDYQAVIGGAGVSQAPAIVILGRDRAARLIEGYVDRDTLAQHVADAR